MSVKCEPGDVKLLTTEFYLHSTPLQLPASVPRQAVGEETQSSAGPFVWKDT